MYGVKSDPKVERALDGARELDETLLEKKCGRASRGRVQGA